MGKSPKFMGMSGCRLFINESGNLVKCATEDKERMHELLESYVLQNDKTIVFTPIKKIEAISFEKKDDYYNFEMEYKENDNDTDLTHEYILKDLKNRKYEIKNNFHEVCSNRLKTVEHNDLRDNVLNQLSKCPNEVPLCIAHGDYGFQNFVTHKGEVYTFDMRKPFISSPLHDVATLILSCYTRQEIDTTKQAIEIFSQYKQQIDIIKKIRVLEFFKQNNLPQTKIEHENLFWREL